MQQFEYKVVPAPQRGEKVRGARTTADRFAATLMTVMNDLGRDGWEYLRADTLPCEERVGLTGKSTSFLHMLVFRRSLATESTKAHGGPSAMPTAQSPQDPAVRSVLLTAETAHPAPRVMPLFKPGHVPSIGPAGGPAGAPAGAPTVGPARDPAED